MNTHTHSHAVRVSLLTAIVLASAACPAQYLGREPGEPDGDSAAAQPGADNPEGGETGGETGETGKPST